jgi:hypothetical protein
MVIEKSLADLCQEADMVFVGRTLAVESRWRVDEEKSIETVVTFAVLEPLYGTTDREVTLRFGGGEVDGLREVIAGVPQFRAGEEVVVFAHRKPSISPVVGFNQGYFRVVDGRVVNADDQPVTGVSERALAFGSSAEGTARAVTLAQFLDTVRARLAERGGGSR